MAEQNENLKELLSQFYDKERADEFTEDLRQVESLLEQNPVAEPGAKLLADIKMKTETALLVKKAKFHRSVRDRAVAVAATFIILAAMSVKFFQQRIEPTQQTQLAVAEFVWDNGDENVETLSAEIEELESDMLAFEFGQTTTNGSGDIDELEIEILQTENDFWKG